jgi:hypothetical protein
MDDAAVFVFGNGVEICEGAAPREVDIKRFSSLTVQMAAVDLRWGKDDVPGIIR